MRRIAQLLQRLLDLPEPANERNVAQDGVDASFAGLWLRASLAMSLSGAGNAADHL